MKEPLLATKENDVLVVIVNLAKNKLKTNLIAGTSHLSNSRTNSARRFSMKTVFTYAHVKWFYGQ